MDQLKHRPDEMAGYLDFLMLRRRIESGNTMLQHFSFQEDPFRVNPDARYLFPSRTHLQALSSLESGFYNNRGFIAMIAPPGMGKTTLLYRFLEDTKDTARSTFIFDIDAECKPRDFVGYILRDFGITPASSSSEMHKQLSEALVKETEAGRKCVVVIDEAQNLSDAVLERVRLLTNFENSQGKLLQIILSGQPQQTEKMMHASLVQLRQRVSTICRLDLLTPQETKDYIDYRLQQAGYSGEALFTVEALDLIAEVGGGTPRTINNLCYNSLSLCSEMQLRQVDEDMVAKVAEDMELRRHSRKSNATDISEPRVRVQQMLVHWWHAAAGEVKIWVPATIGVVMMAMLLIMRLSGAGEPQSGSKSPEPIQSQPAVTAPAAAPAATKTQQPAVSRQASTPGPKLKPAIPAGSSDSTPQPQPKPEVRTAPAHALLTIESNPVGADIEIDEAFVGNSPSTISVAPGTHQIIVEKEGFMHWTKILSVTGGKINLNVELVPVPVGQ